MNKKLISINLAIILIITLFANVVFATSGEDGAAVPGGISRPNADGTTVAPDVVDYIKIDGVIYEIGEEKSGDGWRLDEYGMLYLSGYVGGSIYANYDLAICTLLDDNRTPNTTISAETDEYGIYVDGDLYINNYSDNMVINGGTNKEAIYVNGDLHLTYNIVAVSSSCQALYANSVTIDSYAMIYGGENDSSLTGGKYIGEKYIKTVPIKYGFEHDVILDGNGGLTTDGKSQYKVHLTITTPTSLSLNSYTGSYMNNGINYSTGVFKNNNKLLIGWKDKLGDFLSLNTIKILPYEDSTILYAYWEDEENKAVILENCYNDTLKRETFISPIKVNEKYTLPDMTRDGFIFDGWTSAGKLYKAGEELLVDKTLVFTAQYRKPSTNPNVQNLVIGGKEYDAGSQSGSYSLGWHYYPGNGQYGAQLDIWENYSGQPIIVPCSVRISINGDVFGDENNPAITVYGNASIHGCGLAAVDNAEVVGYGEHPAIVVDGHLSIGGITSEDDFFIIEGGNDNTPAIKAEQMSYYDRFFFVGKNRNELKKANNYNNEHVIKFVPDGHNYYIKVSQSEIIPAPQTHNNYIFVGWKVTSNPESYLPPNKTIKWYMPGEVMDMAGDTILQAAYIEDGRSSVAIALNGNGGITADESRYYITYASTHSLSLYEIPRDKFTKNGYTFDGFNTKLDGSGKTYNYGDCLSDDGKTYIYNLYAQWKKNETPAPPSNPSPSGGGGGAPSENKVNICIGDTKVTATVSGTTVTISKFEPSSPTKSEVSIDISEAGKSVDTAKLASAIIKEIAKSEGVEIKLSDGNVSFDATALETISRELGNNQLSLKIGKATEKSMNSSQKAAVKELNNATVYEFTLKAGSKVISNFNGGKAEVEINVGKGRKGQIKMHHISDKGKITDIDATYDKNTGMAKATLGHFSLYAITFDESVVIEETPVFSDVNKEDWYYDSVISASKLGLMKGVSDTTFAPDDKVTRAMFTTVLHRLSGDTKDTQDISFSDVATDSYYANAVSWAKQNGIISGINENEFAPNDNITREQIATIIYRYAKYKGFDVSDGENTNILSYNDANDISEYAISSMQYACGSGLMVGKTNSTLNPKDNATRAEIAAILQRFIETNK